MVRILTLVPSIINSEEPPFPFNCHRNSLLQVSVAFTNMIQIAEVMSSSFSAVSIGQVVASVSVRLSAVTPVQAVSDNPI